MKNWLKFVFAFGSNIGSELIKSKIFCLERHDDLEQIVLNLVVI